MARILLLFAVVFALASCCTKVACEGMRDVQQIALVGFPEAELDSIVVRTYIAGSTPRQLVDSMITEAVAPWHASSTGPIIFKLNVANILHEHKIEFARSGQRYWIRDIRQAYFTCNTGFVPGSNDRDTRLGTYRVNGLLYYGPSMSVVRTP
jgi:hypothetical protein